jgi:hypothetical protein
MTLATISRAPLIIPRSPARDRVARAAAELQRSIDQLYEEARQEARERAKRDEEIDRRARAHVAKVGAMRATRGYRIEVSKRWLEELATDAIDAMQAQMAMGDANGQRAFAGQLYDRINHLIADLQRLGLMERPKEVKS